MKFRYLKMMGVLLLSCLLIFSIAACSRDDSTSSSEVDSHSVTLEVQGLGEYEGESLKVLIDSKGDYDNPPSISNFKWSESSNSFKAEGVVLEGDVEFTIIHDYRNFIRNNFSMSAASSDDRILFLVDTDVSPTSSIKLNMASQRLPQTDIEVYRLEVADFNGIPGGIGILLDKEEGLVDKVRSLGDPLYTVSKEEFENSLDLALIDIEGKIVAIGYLELDGDGQKSVELESLEEPMSTTQQKQFEANRLSTQSVDEYLAKYVIDIDDSNQGSVDGKIDSLILSDGNEQAVELPDEYIVINHIAIEISNLFVEDSDKFYEVFRDEYRRVGSQIDELELYIKTWGDLYDGRTGEELDEEFEEDIAFGITQVIGGSDEADFEDRASLRISYNYETIYEGQSESMYIYDVSVEEVMGIPEANSFTILGTGENRKPFGGWIERDSENSRITVYILGDESEEDPPEDDDGTYLISTARQLDEFVRKKGTGEDGEGVRFRQIGTIYLDEFENWRPIGDDSRDGEFTAIYEGNGRVITGLQIDRPDESNIGLFGRIGRSGVIDKITLEEASITGDAYVGAIAGRNAGQIIETRAEGIEVHGNYYHVGGLVGANIGRTSLIGESNFYGSVSGEYNSVGGLVGTNKAGAIESSVAEAEVQGQNRVGGLVGLNDDGGEIAVGSSALGSVVGIEDVGGLVGLNRGSLIRATSSYSIVEGERDNIGGLVGRNLRAEVNNSKAHGDISGRGSVGGLIGLNINPPDSSESLAQATDELVSALNLSDGNVIGSEATGDVQGTDWYVGGLIGDNQENTLVKDSDSRGTVSSDRSAVGGLIGRNDGTVENSSYLGDTMVTGESQVGLLIGFNAGSFDGDSTAPIDANLGEQLGFVGQFDNLQFGGVDYHRLIVDGEELVISFSNFEFGDNLTFTGGLNIKSRTDYQYDDPDDRMVFDGVVDFDETGSGDLRIPSLQESYDHTLTLIVTDNRIYETEEIKVVDGEVEIIDPIGKDDDVIQFRVNSLENLNEAKVRLENNSGDARFLREFVVKAGETYTITDVDLDDQNSNVDHIVNNLNVGDEIELTLFTDHPWAQINRSTDRVDITSDTTQVGFAEPAVDSLEPGDDPLSTTINLEQPADYEYLVNDKADAPAPDAAEWNDSRQVSSTNVIRDISVAQHLEDTYIHIRFSDRASQIATENVELGDIGVDALSAVDVGPSSETYGEVEFDFANPPGNLYINPMPHISVDRPSLADDLSVLTDFQILNRGQGYALGGAGRYYIAEVDVSNDVIRFGFVNVVARDYSVEQIDDGNMTISHGTEPGSIKIEDTINVEHSEHVEWVVDIGSQTAISAWKSYLDAGDMQTNYSIEEDIEAGNIDGIAEIIPGQWIHLYSLDNNSRVLEFDQLEIDETDIAVTDLSDVTLTFSSSSNDPLSTHIEHNSTNKLYISENDISTDSLARPPRGESVDPSIFLDGVDFNDNELGDGETRDDLEVGEYYVIEVDSHDYIVAFDVVEIEPEAISVEEVVNNLEFEVYDAPQSTKIENTADITEPGAHYTWYVEIATNEKSSLPSQAKTTADISTGISLSNLDDQISDDELKPGNWIYLYSVDGDGNVIGFAQGELDNTQISVDEIDLVSLVPGSMPGNTMNEDPADPPMPGEHEEFRVVVADVERDFPHLYDDDDITAGATYDEEYDIGSDLQYEDIPAGDGNWFYLYSLNVDDEIIGFYKEELSVGDEILGDVDPTASEIFEDDSPQTEGDPIEIKIRLLDEHYNEITGAVEGDFEFIDATDGSITFDDVVFDDSDSGDGEYRFEITNDTAGVVTVYVGFDGTEIDSLNLEWEI